jgi:hypothetical protein
VPNLYIITPEWTEQQWFNTGGTRAKKYLLAPDGKFYYFKRSQFKPSTAAKPGKDFKFEFWNEVIAYEVGTLLGFTVLRYDIAVDGELMGCISESMINSDREELIEGIKYLQAYSPDFDPAKKEHRGQYTFSLIEQALASAKIGHYIDALLEVIVLDAIIGNGDRHQENWAFIVHQHLITDVLSRAQDGRDSEYKKMTDRIISKLKESEDEFREQNKKLPESFYVPEVRFAPIYDSGSSLGRELLDETVDVFLDSEKELEKYVQRGTSEIHWNNKKLSHFDLIRNLLGTSYKATIINIIKRVIQNYEGAKIEALISAVDEKTPESLARYKIPETRKRLILKIITLRFEILRALINEGI